MKFDFINEFKGDLDLQVVRGMVPAKHILDKSKDFYYIDTGYMGNPKDKTWHRVSKNNWQVLNHYDYDELKTKTDINTLEKRFKQILNTDFQSYRPKKRKPGKNILIVPPTNKVFLHWNILQKEWLENVIKILSNISDRKIIIRPHPRGMRAGNKGAFWISKQYENVEVSQYVDVGGAQGGAGLQKDLDRAWCVVTYNSLSSVEAICEGIPTYAMEDGSMIWPIAQKEISKIENLNYNVDITQWCNDIAYTQWTSKEHGRGESWSHLKPVMGQR